MKIFFATNPIQGLSIGAEDGCLESAIDFGLCNIQTSIASFNGSTSTNAPTTTSRSKIHHPQNEETEIRTKASESGASIIKFNDLAL